MGSEGSKLSTEKTGVYGEVIGVAVGSRPLKPKVRLEVRENVNALCSAASGKVNTSVPASINCSLRSKCAAIKSNVRRITQVPLDEEINICLIGDAGVGIRSFMKVIARSFRRTLVAKGVVMEIRGETAENPVIHSFRVQDRSVVLSCVNSFVIYEELGREKYDIFLIFTAGRFGENDLALVRKLKALDKSFFLVRTKVDVDYKRQKNAMDEEALLNEILQDCWKNIEGFRVGDEDVFLISNHHPNKWDFLRLIHAIVDALPPRKKEYFATCLVSLNDEFLQDNMILPIGTYFRDQREWTCVCVSTRGTMGRIASEIFVDWKRDVVCFFNSDEHDKIGDDAVGSSEEQVNLLTLPNGIQLTYGEIIALAGDFYGVPDSPIIDPVVDDEDSVENNKRRERFLAAYATLAVREATWQHKIQVKLLVKMIEDDNYVRETGDGKYHTNVDWTWASGGRMLQLADKNFDHFQPQAKKAYLVGHQLAIEKAREAGEEESGGKMMEAYSMEAFAAHFLTDSFSSGHIRTPRFELRESVMSSINGNLLSKYMHDEDCNFGIRVKNKRGDEWIAYGDGNLVKNGDAKNFELVKEAVKKSFNQVRKAVGSPESKIDSTDVTDLLPFVDDEKKNNSPLFQMKERKLHRRLNVNDLQDTQTTADWYGPSTLYLLATAKKKNSALPLP